MARMTATILANNANRNVGTEDKGQSSQIIVCDKDDSNGHCHLSLAATNSASRNVDAEDKEEPPQMIVCDGKDR